jgi:hypothetical protein
MPLPYIAAGQDERFVIIRSGIHRVGVEELPELQLKLLDRK